MQHDLIFGLWLEWWPTKPTQIWHGAATESLCGLLGVEKQKQRTKSQKARQERERLRERERGEIGFVR